MFSEGAIEGVFRGGNRVCSEEALEGVFRGGKCFKRGQECFKRGH